MDQTGSATAWTFTGVSDVQTVDSTFAECYMQNTQSRPLRTSQYGISLPERAVVTGVQVEITREPSSGEVVRDTVARLFYDGSVYGDNIADTVTQWPDSSDTYEYGGPFEKFNTTVTRDIVTASTFGFFYRVQNTVNEATAKVDMFRMRAFYELSQWYAWHVDTGPVRRYALEFDTDENGTVCARIPAGGFLDRVVTVPGLDRAPTSGWDVTIERTLQGGDHLEGQALNRTTSNQQVFAYNTADVGYDRPEVRPGDWLCIRNAGEDARGVVRLYMTD